MKQFFVAGLLATAASLALAQATPAGLWRTVDDDGKTEKSQVRITESGGIFTGKVEKVADPSKADAKCTECTDERKDKPIVGMVMLRNVKAAADGTWEGGEILDPNNGKTYKVRLKPIDGGKKLEVRGYVGTPLLGRTQTWLRAE